MRLFRYAALLGVSVLTLSCGGSDDDSSGGGPTTPDKVRVNPSEAAVERGKTVTLTAEVLDASGRLVSGTGVQWSTSDAATASVTNAGVVTGVAAGVARITAAAGNRSGSAVVSVSTTATQTVSSGGGTVSTAAGEVKVTVPAGSVPDGTRITIEPVTTSTPAPGTTVPGTVYKIGVFGIIVGPPPTITVRYSVVGLPPGFDETKLKLSRKIGVFWVPLPSTVNTVEKTITATLPAGSSSIASAAAVGFGALDQETVVGATLFGLELDQTSIQMAVGERRTVTGRIRSLSTGAVATPSNPNASSDATGVATVSSTTISGTDVKTDISAAGPGTATVFLQASATGSSGGTEYFGGAITVTVAPQSVLNVNISGLPAGVNGAVTVTGPNNFSRSLTASQAVSVGAGTYTVAAQNVSASGQVYAPNPASQTVTIAAGETKSASVTYAGTLGSLTVSVGGLPAGANGAVVVTGPNNFSANVTQTQTLTNLAVGSYTVTASNVSAGGQNYVASPPTQTVAVVAGQTATATVGYGVGVGGLTVNINGLPAGVAAPVTVTGPGGFTRTVANSQTLSGLAPGSYTVQATDVSSGGDLYSAAPASQTVSVVVGQTATATVNYTISSGNLAITVSGLPAGANAAIVVTGPNGFNRSVTASQTLSSLAPGSYTVTASNVVIGQQTYLATPTTRTVTVAVGQTATAPVAYALGLGNLTVTITGLPAGAAAAVNVTGPGGFSQVVTSTQTLTALAPGSYTVAANQVSAGGDLYAGTPATQPVTVAISQTATASVAYALASGKLAVTVSGVPAGSSAAIVVTGPNAFSANVTATQTLTGLPPGNYTVTASNITAGGSVFVPTPTTRTVAVAVGQTASAPVAYALGVGSLTVTIAGLPAGVPGAVTVTGPGGFLVSLTASQTLVGLTPGTYTVAATQVSSSGQIYSPTAASQTANVVIGQTATTTVTYALVLGSLTVNVSGLPAGVASAIQVTGPGGFTRAVTASTTITNLTPGSYTVAASGVTSGQAYVPTPTSQIANVLSAQTAVANVTYAPAGTPPDITKSFLDACPAAVPVGVTANIHVIARSASGAGIAGAQILLSASGSGNQFSATSLVADANGFAGSSFSSSVAQVKTLSAAITAAGTTVTPTFSLGVFGPQTATQLVKVSGDNQTITVGTGGAAFVVEARNGAGVPQANIPITWTFGNCFFNTTAANGQTSAIFVAPFQATPGSGSITAAIPGGPSVTFNYTYVSGGSGSVSGRVSQSSVQNTVLPRGASKPQ